MRRLYQEWSVYEMNCLIAPEAKHCSLDIMLYKNSKLHYNIAICIFDVALPLTCQRRSKVAQAFRSFFITVLLTPLSVVHTIYC